MTVEKDTVYRGLLRPAKLFGLPLTSAVILLATVLLGFMWAESLWALATVIVFYPALFGLANAGHCPNLNSDDGVDDCSPTK